MDHVPHELFDDFPAEKDQIIRLTKEDPEFASLAEEYSKLNVRVYAAETNERPMEELAEHQLRKRRMYLKDEIYRRISKA